MQIAARSEQTYRIILVITLSSLSLIVWGIFHSFGIYIKPLATTLGLSRATVSGAISVSWVMHGIFAMVGGFITDRYGPRLVLVVGAALLSLGYLLMSVCHSAFQLYLYYGVIVGIGIGPIWIASSATVARWFQRRRGLMLGLVFAGPGVGQIVIPPLSQYLIDSVGFFSTFRILGLAALCTSVPLAGLVRKEPGSEPAQGDLSAISSARAEKDVPLREALRTRNFWLLTSMWVFVPFAIQLFRTHIFSHASDRGLDESVASLLFMFLGAGIVVGRISWGGIADKMGSVRTYSLVLIGISVSMLSAVIANSLWVFYVVAGFFGFAMGGNDPVYVKLTTDCFGSRSMGSVIGVLTFVFAMSGALGPLLGGVVADRTGSYSLAFLAAGITVLTALLALRFVRRE